MLTFLPLSSDWSRINLLLISLMGAPILLSVALPVEDVAVVSPSLHLEEEIHQTPHMEDISVAGGVHEASPTPLTFQN